MYSALAEPFVVHANLNHHSFFKMVKQDSDTADTESPERLVMEALEKLVMLQDINAMKSPEISLLVNRLLSVLVLSYAC